MLYYKRIVDDYAFRDSVAYKNGGKIMNNLSVAIKKFLQNKNTVTILGVIFGVIILWFFYNMRVSSAITPIRVPMAARTIQPRTKIIDEDIVMAEVPPVMLQGNVVRDVSQVLGKYTNYNTVIPKGSLFFAETIIMEKDLPDASLLVIPTGMVAYNFRVNVETTYGNSIFPGNTIDIYFKSLNDEGVVQVGKLVENVKVLAVKDSGGRHVFENSTEERTPAIIIFAVPEEVHLLLRKSVYLTDYKSELIPVPNNEKLSSSGGEIKLTSQFLKDFINAKTAEVPENGFVVDPDVNFGE